MASLKPFATCLAVLALVPSAPAQEVPVGAVQIRPVISISLNVPSTGKEARRVIYAPPPGWYIRSHRVYCTSKEGLASYMVNTVPARWDFHAKGEIVEVFRTSGTATLNGHGIGGGAKGEASKDRSVQEKLDHRASHHALVVDVLAQGGGLFRGGAGLELSVVAEMVYVGVP